MGYYKSKETVKPLKKGAKDEKKKPDAEGGGTLVVEDKDARAQQLLMTAKAIRLPMPFNLPTAMSIARTEWEWDEDITPTEFIELVIDQFFRDRGYFIGAYYRLDQMREIIREISPAEANKAINQGQGYSLETETQEEIPQEKPQETPSVLDTIAEKLKSSLNKATQ